MQDSGLAQLREELKAQIQKAIKAPIQDVIERLGPVPVSNKSNTDFRRQVTDKLIIDLGEKQTSDLVSMRLTRRSLLDRVAHLLRLSWTQGNLGVLSSWICKRGLKPCFFLHLRRLLRIFSASIFYRDLLSVTVRSR